MSTVPSTNGHGARRAPIDAAPIDGRDLDPVTLGRIMARSGLFPDITRASQAVVKILAGRELGIGPFAAMSDIHLVDGSPIVGARILAALVRQSPVYDYQVVEWTNERCAIDFYRHGHKLEPTVTITDDDARRAGLDQRRPDGTPSNHTRFPRNMKFARAMSNGVGLHCPDLTAGMPVYTPDELGSEDPDADVAPVAPPELPGSGAEGSTPMEPNGGAASPPDRDAAGAPADDLGAVAQECGYRSETVVALCRLFHDARPSELGEAQAAAMADRLRLARVRGVSDERLRALADKGLAGDQRAVARRAADQWLALTGSRDAADRPAA